MAVKRKWPKNIHEFHVPIYGTRVAFVNTEAQWRECVLYLMGDKDEGEWPTFTGGCTQSFWGPNTIHLVGVFCKTHRLSTLAHECAHLAFRVLDFVGVPVVGGEKNEAFCYLLDNLIDEILPHLKVKK